jgi:uncharacterized damage-inducible protein DinB
VLISLLLLLLGAATTIMSAESTITQGERDRAMSYLHATRKQFVDVVSAVNEAQWRFKPGADRWSIAEIAEHLTLVEQATFQNMQKALREPAAPENKEKVQGKDDRIMKGIPDRSRRVQAPEPFRPSGKWTTRDALLNAFKADRDQTIAFVRTTTADLRSHFAPHPFLGLFDVYQWALFLAAHAERHLSQMQEVMADPGFPKAAQ